MIMSVMTARCCGCGRALELGKELVYPIQLGSVRLVWSACIQEAEFLTTCFLRGKRGKKGGKKKKRKKTNIAGLSPGRWPEPEMIPLVHKVSCAWKR
jgi:hypothetical protein